MKKLLLVGLLLTALSGLSQQTNPPATVKLMWDGLCSTNIVGYSLCFTTNVLSTPTTNSLPEFVDDCGTNRPATTNIYFGNYSTNVVQVSGVTNTTCILSNLVRSTTYYFVVKARTESMESLPSNEIKYTVPVITNAPPTTVSGLRIIMVN